MTLSITELIGLLTAITAFLGALGYGAVRNSRKEPSPKEQAALLTKHDAERMFSDVSGLIRSLHQEVRLDNKDVRDKLITIEVKLDTLRHH